MKKKVLSMLVTIAMLFSLLPTTALAAELDMTSEVINVGASNAQDVLDGKYGDITGKTINFTESITDVLVLARPTKYAGSNTEYVCGDGNSHSGVSKTFTDSTEFIAHFGENEWHTTPNYYRTLSGVTFTADEGVTVAGFTFDAGHAYGECYDYVRDVAYTSGSAYYKYSSLENITFKGLTITGQFEAKLYLADCVVENITFDECTFTGDTDDCSNAAIKFLADSQYFTDITVENCEISGYYQGIYIQGVDGAGIVNNSISNTEHNAIALQSHTVAAKGTIEVAENYISDVSNRAIRLNAVSSDAEISVNNNIMVDCGDEDGQLIKAGDVDEGATIDLESNYWGGEDVATAVSGLTAPSTVGITGGTWDDDVSAYLAAGYEMNESGEVIVDESVFAAKVGTKYFNDLQDAIIEAAPAGTVEILNDVVVDEWVMFAETMTIGNGNLITLHIDGLTINGNDNTLTINSIESAGNGNRLFYDAANLNIYDLTIEYADGVAGGIGLQSGELNNVTFSGGVYGVLPGTGEVTIEGCDFKTNGSSIYFEDERDNLVVTGNTFENPDDANVILLRGDVTFTDNTVISGRTVNVVSGSPVVSGNDFGEVRFKVYNTATAEIENNTIVNLVFNDESEVQSTFTANTLSEAAEAALEAVSVDNTPYVAQVGETKYADLQEAIKAAAPAGTVELLSDVTVNEWIMFAEELSISNGNIITLNINGLTIDGNDHTLTVNSIESAGNGNRLFYDAENLNINDLTITYADGVSGGIGLQSGVLSNVTINGGSQGVFPGAGEITITGCTFKTGKAAIYNEVERDNLVVTGNTFDVGVDNYAIYLRGNTTFSDNIVTSGKVNVVSGSPVVTGNDFNDNRFKVYNGATATIESNTINSLVFDQPEDETLSTFTGNTLSEAAQAALDATGAENASYVAQVGETMYADLQEAIKDAAPSGTVEIIADVTVDEWVMFAEALTIGNGNLITLNINGLTINGNNHSLTINSIESAGNGNRLFYDAENLNINDLTIIYADGVSGGIGLQSGELNNITIEGGVYGVLPGTGDVTIEDCTFKTTGTAIYYEAARDNLTVTGNTFELPESANVILLRGTENFTDNTITSGRTVNVVSGSPVVSGNTFADGVRLKVYNNATAAIVNNTITVLAFDNDSEVKSKFEGNILSAEAQAVLDSMNIENPFSVTISIPDGATIVVKDSGNNEVAAESAGTYKLPNGNYTYSVSKSGYYTKTGSFTVNDAVVELTVELTPRSSGGGGGGGSASYTIAVEDTKNGDITVSPSRASSGSTVTITVDPDSGYELDELTVLDKNGKEVKLTKKSDSKYTFKMPSGKVTVEATFAEIEAFENPFTDVAEGAYYYDAVLWAAENGITGGTSATTFSPAVTCTRAQTVTFLWRAAGSPDPEGTNMPFTDVASDAYYYDAVLWAVENGITSGTSATTFSPNATVTRAQNVTFLWRWAESSAVEAVNPFTDVAADMYYHDAVLWAADEGITAGTSATTFSPDDPCLRSQIVTFLYRYLVK